MSGFGLPLAWLTGPLLLAGAAWRSRQDVMPVALLALPVTGLVVARPYWGLMVVPVSLLVLTLDSSVEQRALD